MPSWTRPIPHATAPPGDGVGDEHHLVGRLAPEGDRERSGVDVDQVGDQRDRHPVVGEQRADHPGARWSSPLMPLNPWVTNRAPASMPAACSTVAGVAEAHDTPRPASAAIASIAVGLGAIVTRTTISSSRSSHA